MIVQQENEKAKVGNDKMHWWQALCEYSNDAKTIGFKKRIALFFVLFCIPLTVYVMSFVNGTDTGIKMDALSSSLLTSVINGIFASGSGIVQRIGSGMARVAALPCVSVIAMSMISSLLVVLIVTIIVKIERIARLLWETSNHIEDVY